MPPAGLVSVLHKLGSSLFSEHRSSSIADGAMALRYRTTQNEPIGVLPTREGVDILAWRELPGNAAIWAKLDSVRHRLKRKACYCSVLDECWTSDLAATAQPHHVDQCEPIADGYSG